MYFRKQWLNKEPAVSNVLFYNQVMQIGVIEAF